ncbi:unnamed protein product, partial [Musa textilis]
VIQKLAVSIGSFQFFNTSDPIIESNQLTVQFLFFQVLPPGSARF